MLHKMSIEIENKTMEWAFVSGYSATELERMRRYLKWLAN